MSDTSGPTFYAPLGKWDRDSQSWKTSEATSLWALTLSSLTLPTWGGLHDGELCEHPTPELATSALDSSSLPTPTRADYRSVNPNPGARGQSGVMPASEHSLPAKIHQMLPTPNHRDWKGAANPETKLAGGHQVNLNDVAAYLPTPTSQAAKHGELSPIERHGNRPQDNGNLWVVMPRLAEEALLPTPAVNDMGEGKTLQWWDDWAPRQMSSDGRPAPHGKSLAIEALRASHGATTAPPSPDGNTSPDDQHQPQLSLDVQGIPA